MLKANGVLGWVPFFLVLLFYQVSSSEARNDDQTKTVTASRLRQQTANLKDEGDNLIDNRRKSHLAELDKIPTTSSTPLQLGSKSTSTNKTHVANQNFQTPNDSWSQRDADADTGQQIFKLISGGRIAPVGLPSEMSFENKIVDKFINSPMGVKEENKTTTTLSGEIISVPPLPPDTSWNTVDDNIAIPEFDRVQLDYLTEYIEHTFGTKIDFAKLVHQYTLVCPLDEPCNFLSKNMPLFSSTIQNEFDCPFYCKCDPSCASRGICCPGSIYAYTEQKCTNVKVYPEEGTLSYHMVTTCPTTFADREIIEQCVGSVLELNNQSNVQPVTSFDTLLIYKNRFCAMCNGEENVTEWKIVIKCPKMYTFEDNFESLSDMKEELDNHNCELVYTLDNPKLKPTHTCQERMSTTIKYVDKCNATGLWFKEDADLSWACRHYNGKTFLNFKNLFCFLCNPSIVSTNVPLGIDRCNISNTWDVYDPSLERACLNQPAINRLYPYKNIYCFICNGGNTLSQFRRNMYKMDSMEVAVDEQTEEEIGLISSLTLDIDFYGEDMLTTLVEFLEYNYGDANIYQNDNTYVMDVSDTQIEENNNGVNDYLSICGKRSSCDNSDGMDNPVCSEIPNRCSCKTNCIENGICCTEYILRHKPYSCINSTTLLKLKPATYSYEIKGVHTPAKVTCHPMVDKCPGHLQTPLPSNLTDQQLQMLSGLPVTHGYVAYKNITYMLCNVKDIRSIHIDISIKCNTYFEKSLLSGETNFQSLLNLTSKFCQSTFISYKHSSSSQTSAQFFVNTLTHSVIATLADDIPDIPASMLIKGNGKSVWENVTRYTKCNQTGNWINKDEIIESVCERPITLGAGLAEYNINGMAYKNYACYICNPEVDERFFPKEDIISSCNVTGLAVMDSFALGHVEKMCNETELQTRWLPFRNYYCSRCNLPPVEMVYLLPDSKHFAIMEDTKTMSTYRTLFSLSLTDFTKMMSGKAKPECVNGTFDYALETCRPLFCRKGRVLRNDTCTSLLETGESLTYTLVLKLNTVSHNEERLEESKSSGCDTEEPQKTEMIDLVDVLEAFKKTISDRIALNDESAVYYFTGCEIATDVHCLNPESGGFTVVYMYMVQDIKIQCALYLFRTNNKTVLESVLADSLTDVYAVPTKNGNKTCLKATPKDTSLSDSDFTNNTKCSYKGPTELFLYSHNLLVDRFFTCVQIHLDVSEYDINNETSDLVLANSNIVIKPDFYYLLDSEVRMCLKDYTAFTSNASNTNPEPEDVMSIAYNRLSEICTLLSMACLLATFVTYCMFRSLRTVPGKNNMALCVCLFSAQGFLQFGINAKDVYGIPLCSIIGVLVHYFWLATFFSMNICSFHMFRVFCSKAMSVPSSSKRRFTRYLLYVFGAPFVIVSATLAIYLVSSHGSSVGYGINRCFLSNVYGVLCAFIIPSSIIFLTNFIFFATAFHKIRTSPRIQSSGDKREFFMYIKLCTVVGLTWPLQIVDAVLPLSIFSFFVVGLNALQGVFVFLSYVCNRRVLFLYKKSFSKDKSIISSGTSVKSNMTNSTELTDRPKRSGSYM